MQHLNKVVISLSFLFSASAYADCIKESAVTKWEVISYYQILASAGDRNLAILNTSYGGLKPGQSLTLRFFSPSICPNDNIMIDGSAYRVNNVELIRNK
jgi:hypothetical protein